MDDTKQTLFISPPFGNYFFPTIDGVKTIKGSYTLNPRYGLFSQIVKTLRYSMNDKGWINKIGLKNPGLIYGIHHYNHHKDILSIAILDKEEVEPILGILPVDTNIELNVSCPNLNKNLNDNGIEKFINPKREWCIVKLSPLTSRSIIENYYNMGFRQFHCSNTLPTLTGGLSGPILVPYVCNLIQIIQKYPDTVIIAGGGIQNIDTLQKYKSLGAHHFSISTLFFHPLKTIFFFKEYMSKKIESD